MDALIGLVWIALMSAIIAGVIIWFVGLLKLGLEVKGFGAAMVAGLLIGVLTSLFDAYVADLAGWQGAGVHLVISAIVIYGVGAVMKGLEVKGFAGALMAAVAIAAIDLTVKILILGSAA